VRATAEAEMDSNTETVELWAAECVEANRAAICQGLLSANLCGTPSRATISLLKRDSRDVAGGSFRRLNHNFYDRQDQLSSRLPHRNVFRDRRRGHGPLPGAR
jgi:hypothetical protein